MSLLGFDHGEHTATRAMVRVTEDRIIEVPTKTLYRTLFKSPLEKSK